MQDDGKADAEAIADEAQLKWKLHIFQSVSVQTLIEHFWIVCSVDGGVPQENYIHLNVRLQKSLVPDVELDVMLESSNEDWHEDSPENKPLSREDFALFLFELTALWCNTNVTLSSYLLFLSTTFVWLTRPKNHKGALILKELAAVEFLPESFFELLALAPQEDERWAEMDEEQRFGMWYLQNFGREQETLVLIQRQVFAITHDVRAVFLFNKVQSHDFLALVKKASLDLTRIFPPDACLMKELAQRELPGETQRQTQLKHAVVDTLRARSHASPTKTRTPRARKQPQRPSEKAQRSQMHSNGLLAIVPARMAPFGFTSPSATVRSAGATGSATAHSAGAAPSATVHSAGAAPSATVHSAGASPRETQPVSPDIDHSEVKEAETSDDVPIAVAKSVTIYASRSRTVIENTTQGSFSGDSVKSDKRAYEHHSQDKSNNMVLCGADYLKTVGMFPSADKRQSPSPVSTPEPSVFPSLPSIERSSFADGVTPFSPTQQWMPIPLLWSANWAPLDQRRFRQTGTPEKPGKRRRAQSQPQAKSSVPVSVLVDDFLKSQVQLGDTLDKNDVTDKYLLPKQPKEVYHNQVQPFLKAHPGAPPSSITEVSFGKLVARMCYKDRIGKVAGPWAAPSDPLWGELDHNLSKILTRARKRMMRRKRRLLKTKLFRPHAPPRLHARRLRSFLDKPMDSGNGPYLGRALWDRAQMAA